MVAGGGVLGLRSIGGLRGTGFEVLAGHAVVQIVEQQRSLGIGAVLVRAPVRVERSGDAVVETRVAVLVRVIRIIAGAFLEPLLAVLHLEVDLGGLGRMEGFPAVVVLHRVEQLRLLGVVVVGVGGGHEILGPDQFGRIHVLPDAVVRVVQAVGAVHFGTVHDGLGRIEGALPLVAAVGSPEDAALGFVGIVEELRGGHQGEPAPEGEDDILVDAPLRGIGLGGHQLIRLLQVVQDEVHAGVEIGAFHREVVVQGMRLGDEGHAGIALDQQEIGPGPEEMDLAGEAGFRRFRHLAAMVLDVGQEVVHPVDPLVGAVPDVQDGGTGIVRLAAFLHVHHVVRIHEAGSDVTGGGTAIAEVSLVRDATDVALLVRVGQDGVQGVHIGFRQGVAVEHGVFGELVQRSLVQEAVLAGHQGERHSNQDIYLFHNALRK